MLISNDITLLSDRWSGFLQKQIGNTTGTGLLTGMGFYFLNEYLRKQQPASRQALLSVVDKITNNLDQQDPAFFGIELTEFCHLLNCGSPVLSNYFELDELRGQLHTLIEAHAHSLLNHKRYDPYTGAFFQAYYFLVAKQKSKLTESCISVLEQESKWIAEDTACFDSLFSENRVCLSITHGLAFYITYLCLAATCGIEAARVNRLLKGYSNFLIAQARFSDKHHSFFPDYAGEENSERLCLCYGDAGILLSLLKAFHWLGDTRNYQLVVKMLLQTTLRKSERYTGVGDAGLLYGSSGLILFYDKVFALTGIKEFKESAAYWHRQTLDQADKQYAHLRETPAMLKRSLSLQEGLTGALAVCGSSHDKGINMFDLFFYLK